MKSPDENQGAACPSAPAPVHGLQTLRHGLCALGLLLLSTCVALAVIWAGARTLGVMSGSWKSGFWAPLLSLWPGPALAAGLMYWRQHRTGAPCVVRLGWILGVILSVPLAAMGGTFALLAAWSSLPVAWHPELQGVLFHLVVGLAVSVVLFWSWQSRWRMLTAMAAPAGLVLAWLVWDEPASATPLEVATLAPPPPRAAESHAVARWFTVDPQRPSPQNRWPTAIGYLTPDLKPNEWRVFVVANREDIRADWDHSGPARDWIAALDAFEVIGDTTESYNAPDVNIQALSATCFLHCAYASLVAIEGRGDEAVVVLRPVLSVSRKLQPAARSSARFLGAKAVQRACQNAARFVLQTSAPTPHALRSLGDVLGPADDLAAAYQRVFLCDCASAFRVLSDMWREAPGWERWLSLPLYRPNATANLAARCYRDLVGVAMEGRSEGLRAYEQSAQRALGTRSFKNAIGRCLVLALTPEISRKVSLSLSAEDDRRALLAVVQAKLAGAEQREAAGKGVR